jgi:hemerythrin-like domain-containing protein
MEKWMEIIKDLLDDHNVILYALFILACIYPGEAKPIIAGMLGFWAKGKVS